MYLSSEAARGSKRAPAAQTTLSENCQTQKGTNCDSTVVFKNQRNEAIVFWGGKLSTAIRLHREEGRLPWKVRKGAFWGGGKRRGGVRTEGLPGARSGSVCPLL